MSQKRVLHVISSLSLGNGITGVVMNYYRNINREIIQFDFLYFEDSQDSYIEEIISLGGRVFKIDPPGIGNLLYYKKYLNDYFKNSNFNYDIVHSHELVLLSLISTALKNNKTKHIIAHSHSVAFSYHPLKTIRNFILSLPLKKISDSFCSCSNASAEFWFGKKYVKEGKVNLVNNAIDCEKFLFNETVKNEVRKSIGLKNNFVIGHVGRLSREKNQIFLIDIFREVVKKNPNSLLLLIGEGPMYSELRDKVHSLNLSEKVIFLGQRNDVNKLYQAMDVFVFPSISEGLGIAAIEAQISGVPCLISNTVTKEVNILNARFESLKANPKVWAEKILKFNGDRNTTYKNIEKTGYCIKSEANKLEKYYEEILDTI